jgi:cytochrome P450
MDRAEIDLTDLDRFDAGFPHEVFTELRRDAPVWWHPPTAHTPDGAGFWVLSRHVDIHAAAADGATFSSERAPGADGGGTIIEDLAWGFASGVLLNMMDDPRHQRIRKLITPAVSPRALARLEDGMRERTVAIVDAIAERGECDFLVDVAAELPLQAIAQLLGIPQADRHALFEWANATLDYDDRDLGEANERSLAASAAMFEYGSSLLAEKQRCPADDLLSAVATARIVGADGREGPITDLEQQMFFNLLIAAGSETTRNSIAVGLLALVDHPAQLAELRNDRSLMPTAIEEMLRWASSTPYNRRTATVDTTIGGEAIGAGDKVTLWWASANRDESVFDDPFTFDIRRSPNPHLTFGHGSHFCLGANLARVEMRVVFDEVLDRLDDLALAGPVEWTRSNKHTGVRHMPISFTARR